MPHLLVHDLRDPPRGRDIRGAPSSLRAATAARVVLQAWRRRTPIVTASAWLRRPRSRRLAPAKSARDLPPIRQSPLTTYSVYQQQRQQGRPLKARHPNPIASASRHMACHGVTETGHDRRRVRTQTRQTPDPATSEDGDPTCS